MIIEINNIKVKFPFEPYDLQKAYMTKVIEALNDGQNAVLESPTGTGKTLCLLCSSLAWQEDQKLKMANSERTNLQKQAASLASRFKNEFNSKFDDMEANKEEGGKSKWRAPTIIYTSRTHSQLTQAMKELKNSAYNNVLAVSLGSRDQLCINKEVLTEGKTSGERNTLCQIKVKKRACSLRERVDKVTNRAEVVTMPIKDIEDLVTIGTKCKACPYYLSRDLAANADVVFMPYNYLLDAKILKSFKINLNGSVVILDEAHNVERVCEDSASILFASSDITNCIQDITHLMKVLEKDDEMLMVVDDEVEKDFTIEDLAHLKEIMLKFETQIDSIESVFNKQGKTFPGGKLFELLEASDINQVTYPSIRQLLDSLILFLTQSSGGSVFGRKGGGLMKIQEVVDTAFFGIGKNSYESYKANMERGYRVHVEIEPEKKANPDTTVNVWLPAQSKLSKSPKIINYWCFNPGFGMANVLAREVRSIILTSGTLAPLKPLISELAIRVDHRLENPHIIKNSQVAVKIVCSGPDKEPLDGAFQNRDNPKYIRSLGMSIQGISRVTPYGVLVFFSSYTLMNKCNEVWEKTGLLKDLNELKPVFMEPRKKDEFQESIKNYYEHVQTRKGAIYMAVLRGKVSEGLDFNDNNARAVIICGIPFPPYLDPRVVLKKSYLDLNRTKENQLQSGGEWYTLEAVRAVNQAIGRVIRHKDDYGAILLCDHRFHYYKSQLSRWIQPHLNAQAKNEPFGKIVGELAKFFRTAEAVCAPVNLRTIDVDKKVKNGDDDAAGGDKTKIDTREMVKIQTQLESSSDIYSSSASTLKTEKSQEEMAEVAKYIEQMKMKKTNGDNSLFGGLNQDVKVIDFNSTAGTSSSTNAFTFKNPRPIDFPIDGEKQSKRPRLKMIPNANAFPDEKIMEDEEKQVEITKENILEVLVTIKRETWELEVPKEKPDFISALKLEVDNSAYKMYLQALCQYHKQKWEFKEVMDDFLRVFKVYKKSVRFLRGSRTFLRSTDRHLFDVAINKHFVIID